MVVRKDGTLINKYWQLFHKRRWICDNIIHCNTAQISVVNRFLALRVISCVGEKNVKIRDRLQFFCKQIVINVLNNKTIIQLNLAEYEYPLILANSANGLVVQRFSARFRKINTRRIGYMIVLFKTREYPTTPKVTLKRVDTQLHRCKVANTTPSPPEYYRGYAATWLRRYAASHTKNEA